MDGMAITVRRALPDRAPPGGLGYALCGAPSGRVIAGPTCPVHPRLHFQKPLQSAVLGSWRLRPPGVYLLNDP